MIIRIGSFQPRPHPQVTSLQRWRIKLFSLEKMPYQTQNVIRKIKNKKCILFCPIHGTSERYGYELKEAQTDPLSLMWRWEFLNIKLII